MHICKICGQEFKDSRLLGCHVMAHKNNEGKTKRRIEYESHPHLCLACSCSISYERRNNKFCSRSCAATYNNQKRGPMPEEQKEKLRTTLTG